MAIHVGNLPRLRQSAARPRYVEERKPRSFSFEKLVPMARLNELASDGTARIHATGLFIIGLVTLWVAIGFF